MALNAIPCSNARDIDNRANIDNRATIDHHHHHHACFLLHVLTHQKDPIFDFFDYYYSR
jgi:hypothetical protein